MEKHLSKLRNKVLDISLRNPQINFRPSRTSTISFVDANLEKVYDFLVKEEKAYDINLDNEKIHNVDDLKGISYKYNSFYTDKNSRDLQTTLNTLRNRTKLANEEMGLHPLYMVFGFLDWYDGTSKKRVSSPLLMVPIEIKKQTTKRFQLRFSKDDIILNPTLVHKLELEQVFITGYDLFDHDGFSIDALLERISTQKEMKTIKGEVKSGVQIGLFASSSLYMYKDLLDNESKIAQNEILGRLYGERDTEGSFLEPEFVDPKFLDENLDLAKTHIIFEADSSQQVAILAAQDNMSFVLQGPPGTGKSQTITNIIADAIANDKKVLFVAEKKAALDVVFEKLKQAHLDDFVLDLHSYGAKKDLVISNLVSSLEQKKTVETRHLEQVLENLIQDKGLIEGYLHELTLVNPVINASIYELYGHVLVREYLPLINYRFNTIYEMTPKDINELLKQIKLYQKHLLSGQATDVEGTFSRLNTLKISQPEKFIKEFKNAALLLEQKSSDIVEHLETINKDIGLTLPITLGSLIGLSELDAKEEHPYQDLLSLKNYEKSIINLEEIIRVQQTVRKIVSSNADLQTLLEFDLEKIVKTLEKTYSTRFSRIGKKYAAFVKPLEEAINYKKPTHEELIGVLQKVVNFKIEEQQTILIAQEFTSLNKEFNWNSFSADMITYLENGTVQNKTFTKPQLRKLTQARTDSDHKDVFERQGKILKDLKSSLRIFQQTYNVKKFNYLNLPMASLLEVLAETSQHIHLIDSYQNLTNQRQVIIDLGYQELLEELTRFPLENWNEIVMKKYYSMWVDYIYFKNNRLNTLTLEQINIAVQSFQKNDRQYLKEVYKKIQNHLYQKFPHENDENIKILLDESIKKRGQKTIRQILDEMLETVFRIKPCFLMSPLSVSAYLPSVVNLFDLVVFDEASQIIPENAVGSIYRGKQLIVVGDHEQLPPTSFFQQVISDDLMEEVAITDQYESILDISRAHLPSKKLRWHYRSRHESLIRYSNNEIYKNLIIFPEAFKNAQSLGVRFDYVADGYFDERQNVIEAVRIAQLIFEHIDEHPKRTLGVVSFSVSQQETILRELNKLRRTRPQYDWFFDEDQQEPFFVKNLENVQGDERDTIILSVCYAKDASGKLSYRFGPINQDVGYRRLNVATTRAKFNTIVVSSLLPEEILRTEPRGVAFLKGYLDYAKNGYEIEQKLKSQKKVESNVEKDIYNFLINSGYDVDLYINPFVQLAIKNPKTSKYEIGIQIDGFNESRNYTTRDKFINANFVLEQKEWKLLPIWSFDWFRNNEKNKHALLKMLQENYGVIERKPLPEIVEIEKTKVKKSSVQKEKIVELRTVEIVLEDDEITLEIPEVYPYYKVTDKDEYQRREEETNDEHLKRYLQKIVEMESPIHQTIVFSRLAEVLGDKYLGAKLESLIIQQIISWHIEKKFIYKNSIVYDLKSPIMFRIPKTRRDTREINQIALEELAMGIQIFLTKVKIATKNDIMNEMMRVLLIEKNSPLTKNVEGALSLLTKQGIVTFEKEKYALEGE